MEKERREKTEIIIELLNNAKDYEIPTKLMLKTNINMSTLNRYANALVKAGYMEREGNSPRVKYRTTLNGIDFLLSLRKSEISLRKFNEFW